jgi:hypothetical protein
MQAIMASFSLPVDAHAVTLFGKVGGDCGLLRNRGFVRGAGLLAAGT